MRVDFTNLGLETPEKSKAGRTGQTGAASAADTASSAASSAGNANAGVDQTSLAFSHARVQSLATQALAAPEVRQEKVGPLQRAIANGNYSVDSGQVADAMAADLVNGWIR
jgi:negative regulator of flagellin synthesis FlgM